MTQSSFIQPGCTLLESVAFRQGYTLAVSIIGWADQIRRNERVQILTEREQALILAGDVSGVLLMIRNRLGCSYLDASSRIINSKEYAQRLRKWKLQG